MTAGKPHLPGRRWRTVAAVLVLVLGTVVSLVMSLRARTWEAESRQVEFSQRATAGATALQRSIQSHLELLQTIGVFYATSPVVNRAGFREFTQGLLKRYPGVQALAWVPRIVEAERETYVAMARKDGLAEFQITERTSQGQVVRAARRDAYYPIFYIEPLASNLAMLGSNLGAEPARLDTLQKAISTGEVVASPWTYLAQETDEQYGCLLLLPIYKNGMPHNTLEERRANLQGFALATLRLGPLVERALKGFALGNMNLYLTDVTDAASRYLLYLQIRTSQTPLLTILPRQNTEAEAMRAELHWETAFNVAGRRWSVLMSPTREALNAPSWQAWQILGGGLLCTMLIAGFLRPLRV